MIRLDGGTQPRATLNQEWIDEYAARHGGLSREFPPVIVFHDGSVPTGSATAPPRSALAKKRGLAEIGAEVRQGTRRDAILFSVGANAVHGHRRTNDDKRRAVLHLARR